MKLSDYIRLAEAARLVGKDAGNVTKAADAGQLQTRRTGCGLRLTTERWVRDWAASLRPRKRNRDAS
ncbi:MAG: hypothetical protein KDA60_16830 [Planctomycetales bacterium]|nr:hypothetical protein [Planctomycetales bacterium]